MIKKYTQFLTEKVSKDKDKKKSSKKEDLENKKKEIEDSKEPITLPTWEKY